MDTHILPTRLYVGIFLILLTLTAVTVTTSFFDLGGRLNSANVLVAMSIACGKALLVVLFFMHLRYSPKLTMATVVASVFFLFLLLGLTMTDYLTRAWLTYPGQ